MVIKIGRRFGKWCAKMVSFLDSETLKPFISRALSACIQDSIEFISPHGGRSTHGYEATLLVDICSAILDARNAKELGDCLSIYFLVLFPK